MKPKKMLSLLLSLAMILSLVSVTAFAASPDASENGFSFASLFSKKYTYLYAALDWDEYWANEGVYAAGSTAANDQLDSHDEHDKGAFDAVSRATANHGLHRGSFQQVATIYAADGTTCTVSHWSEDGKTFYTTDGTAYGWNRGTVTKPDGTTVKMDHYEISGTKYVPVRVASSDLNDFCSKYATVKNGEKLVGGYSENKLAAYEAIAEVDANTNGLKYATKSGDGYTFSAAHTGTGSGIQGEAQKTASDLIVTVRSGSDDRNQVLAIRQAVVVAEEEAHPAEVEEVAEATASNDMQKLQKPKLLTGCGKLMQTRKHIIFYNKTEKPFCVFSVFF